MTAETPSFDFILFGASGDLALKKLIPSLYRSLKEGQIDNHSRLIFCYRDEEKAQKSLAIIEKALLDNLTTDEQDKALICDLLSRVEPVVAYVSKPTAKGLLAAKLTARVRVFYLAVPPGSYGDIAGYLDHNKLITSHSRLVVEKPIGKDLPSSIALNDTLASYFSESQIYRIDHYLGKETVQNLLALRFSNLLFQQCWNANYIDHVQISINESVGVAGRGAYYEGVGALKDMVQNHLLQLLCLIAMDSPNELCADAIHLEKVKILKALRPFSKDSIKADTVRGQYVAGQCDGELVKGYLEDFQLAQSSTESYVAIKAFIDNWHWADVPFYLRTGKRLNKPLAQIVIQFKSVPHSIFKDQQDVIAPNKLIIQLQPEERLQLLVTAKDMTKTEQVLKPAVLDLNLTDQIKGYRSYAYKRLILDAVKGDKTLFIHRDEVEAAWAWIDPLAEAWQQGAGQLHLYRAGSEGPDAANQLLARDGRYWMMD